jgi:hypothetical protein
MGEAIGPTLGYAVAIAISPIPIAAVILMLFSERARLNSLAFMFTWVAGIALVTSVMLFIPGLDSDGGGPNTTVGWVKLALGVLLLERGFARWRSRPKGDDVVEPPRRLRNTHSLTRGSSGSRQGFFLATPPRARPGPITPLHRPVEFLPRSVIR